VWGERAGGLLFGIAVIAERALRIDAGGVGIDCFVGFYALRSTLGAGWLEIFRGGDHSCFTHLLLLLMCSGRGKG